jgi:hypothetical protein
MKKLLSILTAFTLFGCEKYELPSAPSVAGKWYFHDYKITRVQSLSPIEIIENDTICINNFGVQSFVSGNILMKQNYQQTAIDRRFIKNVTTWDFNGPAGAFYFPLEIDGQNDIGVNVHFPKPYLPNINANNIYTSMVTLNEKNGITTNYTFITDKFGAGYSRVMELTSPNISSDVYLTNGVREKAVTVFVTLIFKRN